MIHARPTRLARFFATETRRHLRGDTVLTADGPPLWPMWRDPR
jgi:hypothetical protein